MSVPPYKVLVVDDSAFARKVLREVLRADPRFDVVGFARDGLDALEKIAELRPDVITLDLVMPELDGLGVLDALRSMPSAPRVVVVTMSDADSELGVRALQAGAFDVVHKPTALATERLYELGDELLAKVHLAASAAASDGTRPPATSSLPPHVAAAPTTVAPVVATRTSLVLVGASTGGPRAVSALLESLPAGFPVPIAVVVHMPAGYTEAFAQRLDRESALRVFEAKDGSVIGPGDVAVARGGMHLLVRGVATREGDERAAFRLGLDVHPVHTLHRPSVDVLFESGAAIAGERTLAVVLTGMGTDGTEGARAIRAAGGRVLVEHARTCIVHGMPRAVAAEGLADAEVPLEQMGRELLDRL